MERVRLTGPSDSHKFCRFVFPEDSRTLPAFRVPSKPTVLMTTRTCTMLPSVAGLRLDERWPLMRPGDSQTQTLERDRN